jgi:EmrB/QacA subfamily drug resistance transporter
VGDPAPAQTRHPTAALIVIGMALLVVTVDNSILNIALPELARDLHATTSDLQWILDSYVLVYACLMLTAGFIGDRIGRRRTLRWGAAGFGLASGIASFAPSATTLILARGLMGACAAFLTPVSLSVITNMFPDPGERTRAIGIWAAVAAVGGASGPVVGGLLLARFWWGSVFLVNVPITAAVVILLPLFAPESRDPTPHAIDVPGAALSIVGLVPLVWSTISGPDRGWSSTPVLSGFVVGVVFLGAFCWWELHTPHPMLDLRIFRLRSFAAASFANATIVSAWAAMSFAVVQLLQSVLGYSPLRAGLGLAPFAVVGAFGGLAGSRLSARFGRKEVMTTSLVLACAGMALLLLYRTSGGYPLLAVMLLVFMGGQSVLFTLTTASAMEDIPPGSSGVASAANTTLRQLGLAFGIAMGGSILSTVYRSHVVAATRSLGLTPDSILRARRSIASAVLEARALPAESGSKLLGAARHSFVPGFHASMGFGLAACLVGLFVAVKWLPRPARGAVRRDVDPGAIAH